MFPEIPIDRVWSQVSYTYRQAVREGENCRPPHPIWQIPFIHSVQITIISNFFCIYGKAYELFPPCGTCKRFSLRCIYKNYACAQDSLGTIVGVVLPYIRYLPQRIFTKFLVFAHAQLMNKSNPCWLFCLLKHFKFYPHSRPYPKLTIFADFWSHFSIKAFFCMKL